MTQISVPEVFYTQPYEEISYWSWKFIILDTDEERKIELDYRCEGIVHNAAREEKIVKIWRREIVQHISNNIY